MISQETTLQDDPWIAQTGGGSYQPPAPTFSPEQIQAAINASRQQGFSDADIARGAQANFGVDISSYFSPTVTPVTVQPAGIASLPVTSQPVVQPAVQDIYQPTVQTAAPQTFGSTDLVSQVTAWKPANEWAYDPNNQFAGTNITLADGQVVPYNAIVEQVLKRYDEDKKNPTLAVKSGVQLGISDDVLKTLPGVDAAALAAGHQLVDSGAFEQTATNRATTESDLYGQSVAPVGSALYNARIAAGLDAYGLPPAQVEALKAAGKYREPAGIASLPNSTAVQQAVVQPVVQSEPVNNEIPGGIQSLAASPQSVTNASVSPITQQATVAQASNAPTTTYDPTQFRNLTTANATSDAQVIQNSISTLYNAGYTPDQAVQLINTTYGTNATTEDYNRALNNAGIQKVNNPQLAVFGDSISAAMGFNQNPDGTGQADTTLGTNLAQYLGSNLGVYSANNSLGGVTTQDSLKGTPVSYDGKQLPLDYGNFANYITEHKPEVAVLRFGAADAIKLNDPNTTLGNIESMVNIANQNGTKPILVGVTPFAKMGDFNAGNINSGITDSMIASADKINEGIKALADKYGLQFIDVRQVPVPQGGLLDGVHPSGAYGNAMGQYIADQIKSGGTFAKNEAPAGIASLASQTAAQPVTQTIAQPESPKYSTDQIISAINESRKQGFSDADIIKGAQANFGVDVASLVNAGPALKNTITTTLADTTKSDLEKLGIINKAAADNNLTPAQVAQATGLNPTAVTKIFDTFNTGITSLVTKLSQPTVSDVDKTKSLLQLETQYGVSDAQLAKSMGKSVDEVKSYLDPVRNFSSGLTDVVTNKTASDVQAFIDQAKQDPRVAGLYSAALDNIQKKVPLLELRDSVAGTAKGMDVAKGYTDFVAAVNQDPALKQQYGTQADAIQKVIDVSKHAADESYGGQTQPWMFSTFMGLDKNTVSNTPAQLEFSKPTTKEVTRTVPVGRGGGSKEVTETVNIPAAPIGATPTYQTSRDRNTGDRKETLTGYSKEVTMPGDVNGDWKVTANYDVNGKLTGYSLPGRDLWASDDVKYIPTWDASGKANPIPVDAKNRGVLGGAIHGIQQMGPIGQLALMAATGGLGSLAAGALAQAGMGTVLSQALGSGLVGGGMSSLGGGNFAQGFAGGSLGSFGTQLAQGYMPTINTGTPLLDQYITKALPNLAGAEFSAAATGQDLGKTGLASLINTGTNMAMNSLIKGAMPDTLSPELQKAFSGVSGQLLTSLLQGQTPDFQKAVMNTIVQNAMSTAKDAVKTATKKE
jgi:hypothetical protein